MICHRKIQILANWPATQKCKYEKKTQILADWSATQKYKYEKTQILARQKYKKINTCKLAAC